MIEWYPPIQLCGLDGLPNTVRAIRYKAAAENWQSRPRAGRGGGNEYHISSLPDATRIALATQSVADGFFCAYPQSSAYQAGAEQGRKFAEADARAKEHRRIQKEQGLVLWNGLSQERKAVANAKHDILTALSTFIKTSRISKTRAIEAFVLQYQQGKIQLSQDTINYTQRKGQISISKRTIIRWQQAYKEQGLYGLANGYKGRRGTSIPPDMQEHIIGLIAQHPHIKDRRIMDGLKARFFGHDLPGASSVARWVKKYKRQNAGLLLYMSNPDAWRNKHMVAIGNASEKIERLNQVWEFDSTPADIILADGKRYTIIGVIDLYSRRLKLLVASSSNSMAVAALTRAALLDWGVPETVKTDNGSDYISKHMVQLFQNLDIWQDICPPFTPEAKPHIERAFKTFSHGLVELMPGYIGHSVADRKAIESRRSFADRIMSRGESLQLEIDADQLQQLCDQWCKVLYHHDVHSGIGTTPAEKARNWMQPIKRIKDQRALDMLLCPAPKDGGWRSVGKEGIRAENTTFWHNDLAPYVGQPDKVLVLLDLADYGLVHVYRQPVDDEEGMQFLCTAADPVRKGFDRAEVATIAKNRQKKIVKEGSKILRTISKKISAETIHQDILDHRTAMLHNIIDIPQRSEDYTTAALEQAAKANASREIEVGQSARENHEIVRNEMRKKAAQVVTIAPNTIPDRPRERYRYWQSLDKRWKSGEQLEERDNNFYVNYQLSPEFRGFDIAESVTGR